MMGNADRWGRRPHADGYELVQAVAPHQTLQDVLHMFQLAALDTAEGEKVGFGVGLVRIEDAVIMKISPDILAKTPEPLHLFRGGRLIQGYVQANHAAFCWHTARCGKLSMIRAHFESNTYLTAVIKVTLIISMQTLQD